MTCQASSTFRRNSEEKPFAFPLLIDDYRGLYSLVSFEFLCSPFQVFYVCRRAKIQGLSRWDWPAQQMASITRWRMSRRRPGVVCEISWVCWKSVDVSGPWNNLGGLVFVRRVRCFGPMFVWLNMPRNYVRLLDINFCWLKPLIDPYAKVSLAHFGWFSLLPRVPYGSLNRHREPGLLPSHLWRPLPLSPLRKKALAIFMDQVSWNDQCPGKMVINMLIMGCLVWGNDG